MNDRYLYRAKRKKDGKWTTWNALTGIHGLERIEDDTICQCTGLKDKNGKLIWENDIVTAMHTKFIEEDGLPFNTEKYIRNYIVEYCNTGSHCGWRLRNKSIHFSISGNTIYNHNIQKIGNIFDNPELLEVGE